MGEVTPIRESAGAAYTRPIPIRPQHDTSKFDCGNESLNNWLAHKALEVESHSARCFVITAANSRVVVGYYRIVNGGMSCHAKICQRNSYMI
jgi:hypothetical protein